MADYKKKYYSQLVELLRTADVAIEVVDARFIEQTRVPKLERRFGKKVVMVASKSDLVPKGKRIPGVIYVSTRTNEGMRSLLAKAAELAKNNPYRRTKDAKMVVFGVPNVGKSSLINVITKRHVAKIGLQAGTTRGPQWIRVTPELLCCDTAGIVTMGEGEEELALKGAMDAVALKRPVQTALKIIEMASAKIPNPVFEYYGIEKAGDAEDLLGQIARKRGLLGKGGEPQISEISRVIIRDFQKGKIII